MKMKKELLALTTAVLLTASCTLLPVGATSTSFELVELEAVEPVEPTYTVTVPSRVTLSRQVGEPTSVTIEVSDISDLPEDKQISVTIASLEDGAGRSVQQFYLCGSQGEGETPLTVSTSLGDVSAPEDSVIGLELASFAQDGSAAYQVALCSEASKEIDYQATILHYGIGLTDFQ